MKKSEIILLVATVIVMGGGLYLTLTPEETAESAVTAVSAGDLQAAREKFHKNLKLMKDGAGINEEFKRFAVSMEDTKTAGDPGMAATTQLFNVLHDQLGIQQPVISISREELIQNVEEYYFINIKIQVGGTEAEMKKLLRNMEQLGFLIKSFKMSLRSHGQDDQVDMDVTVSRLIKHDDYSRKKLGVDKKGSRKLQRI
jgi:acetolactate synthase regulatory subunit